MKLRLTLNAAFMAATMGIYAQTPMKAPAGGKAISDELIGIFFEDISSAADGGLYAELVQNGSFEFNPTEHDGWGAGTAWRLQRPGHSLGRMEPRMDNALNDNNPTYMRIYIERVGRYYDFDGWTGIGLQNDGFDGFSVKGGAKYNFSAFLRNVQGDAKDVRIVLAEPQGWGKNPKLLAEAKAKVDNTSWRKFEAQLTPNADCKNAVLQVLVETTGAIDMDEISLMPQDTYKGHGLRKDLAQALADLHPKFMRFPGGCASEGPNYFGQVFWKNSVGKPEERLGFRNHWGYWTSQYVGFYEYFLMAESLGASPLPVLNNGVTCQFVGHSYIAPLETEADRKRFYDIFVKDALDLIEFCNGATTTKWGKLRAEMGHPAPFNLKYLGVGNENQGKEFWERFDIMYKAIKAQYPDIIIVSTAGARDAGREFDNNYAEIDEKYPDTYVDEHYYKNDEWFFSQGNRYAPGAKRGGQGLTYDRSKPTRVFVGEFANNNTNNAYRSTLAEAAYWLSLERNSDMVVMAAYAPLFCKKGYNKWNSNLIWFDNRGLWRTTNYYYQQLFSLGGNRALKYQDVMNGSEVDGKVYTSPTIDTRTGTVYLKFVNAEATDKQISVNLNGADTYTAEVEYITAHDTNVRNQGDQNYYSSHPDVPADFSYAEAVTPQTKKLGTAKGSFTFTMPENSVGVLRLMK